MARVLGLGEEAIDPNEQAAIDGIVKLMGAPPRPPAEPGRPQGAAPRGQHPKHHGCVTAKFTVEAGVPAHLRAGVFAAPATFDALIRFSNGKSSDDREADVHGMAIKLLDVPGPKLLAGQDNAGAQDFVLVDHETFFLGDIEDYERFNREFIESKKGTAALVLFVLKQAAFRPSLLFRIKAFTGKKLAAPLASHYWSTTPYRLGDRAVKYMAVSPLAGASEGKSVASKDGLSEALVAHLRGQEARFDFGVHVQTDPAAHPVEDATVNWSSNGAPFVKLATIVIPPQRFEPQSDLAENTAFSPWHALEAHRPLGGINRARRHVYEKMMKERHRLNGREP